MRQNTWFKHQTHMYLHAQEFIYQTVYIISTMCALMKILILELTKQENEFPGRIRRLPRSFGSF